MFEYDAFGLRWGSSLALPFAERDGTGRPDVTVRFGGTPASLPAAHGNAPHAWEAEPGGALLHVADVARYLVTPCEIVIDRRGGSAEDIAVFLVGPAVGALLLQRGVVPLHAAAVETGAGTVLLLGDSGVGKSALAAALVERGAALVADDVTGLAPGRDGVLALPAFPRLRLWADALPPGDRRQRVRRNLEQYWKPAARFCAAPQPVRAAFVLQEHNRDFDIAPVPAAQAFWALWEHTYRRRLVDALGQRPAHYRTGMALARSVPFVRARRPHAPFRPGALADRIEAHLHGIAAAPASASSAAERAASRRRMARSPSAAPAGEPGTPAGPGIVWLASYSKSGSSWLRALLTNYLRDDAEPASINALVGSWEHSHRDKFDELVGLDSSDLRAAELARYLLPFRELLARELSAPRPGSRGCGPRFSKTHEAYRGPVGGPRFPSAGAVGEVYLVRNPLDVAVSMANFLDWPIDRVLRRMNDPAADEASSASRIVRVLPNPMTTWSGHVSSWLDQTALRTQTIRYEDLQADPCAGFGRIVRFAGLQWDAERLERAVEQSAFPRLHTQEDEVGFNERPVGVPSYFRAGVAGSWRTALTRSQVRAVVDVHGPAMARLGYLREAETFLSPSG